MGIAEGRLRRLLERPATTGVRTLYIRGLALVHVIAFLSVWGQAQALIGHDGLAPFAELFAAAEAQLGPEAPWALPSVLWLSPTDTALHVACGLGTLVAFAILAGAPFAGPLLLGLAILYVSLSSAGWVFYNFQWDTLLVETTVVAAFVAPWRRDAPEPPLAAWLLQWWLLFRLMFFAGVVKLTSGDPTWANFTALDVHFWTQPLPNPLSRLAHFAPGWLHAVGVGGTFVVELGLPFLILAGRHARWVAFVGFTGLMLGLTVTGNYGFFQLLSIVLALTLLDDEHLAWFGCRPRPMPPRPPFGRTAAITAGVALFTLSVLQLVPASRRPEVGQQALQVVRPFRIVNRYGLFANMTTDRPEVIFEGSTDQGATWTELPLRYKPGPLDRVPPQVAPHMPRLDWQLWFAALGDCRRHPWVVRLMREVANGNPRMDGFFRPGTFDEGRPAWVRAVRYRYTFAPFGEGRVWNRVRLGPYCQGVVR
ncbi:MAG: lipase maturation factor family protein [Myxococcota bacterium]